jgi:hypothetical protein
MPFDSYGPQPSPAERWYMEQQRRQAEIAAEQQRTWWESLTDEQRRQILAQQAAERRAAEEAKRAEEARQEAERAVRAAREADAPRVVSAFLRAVADLDESAVPPYVELRRKRFRQPRLTGWSIDDAESANMAWRRIQMSGQVVLGHDGVVYLRSRWTNGNGYDLNPIVLYGDRQYTSGIAQGCIDLAQEHGFATTYDISWRS